MAITTKQQSLGSLRGLAAALMKSSSSLVPGRVGILQAKQADMFADFYKLLVAAGAFGFLILGSGTTVSANSLDDHYWEISKFGGLAGLCRKKPHIQECALGVGEWKPDLLEKVKANAPFCYVQCEHDQYGFVKSSSTDNEYPQIVTKDFDGSSASRGVEFIIYPLALQTYKYKGCAGCSLIKTYPTRVSTTTSSGAKIFLPRLARGTFYLPRPFRAYALERSAQGKEMVMNLEFGDSSENRRISKKSTSQYAEMLNQLRYSLIR